MTTTNHSDQPSTAVITNADTSDNTAQSVARLVAALIDGRTPQGKVSPAEILILCRQKDTASEIIAALRELGIKPFRCGSMQNHSGIVSAIPSYLRVIAGSPPPLRHLAKSLYWFYGIGDGADVDWLKNYFGHQFSKDTWEAFRDMDDKGRQEFSEEFNVSTQVIKTAQDDIQILRQTCSNRSIWGAYSKLSSKINLEEYLTENDRHSLNALESSIEELEEEYRYTVLSEKTTSSSGSILDELQNAFRETEPQTSPEQPADSVGIGTIHNAKGDEERAVIVPNASDGHERLSGDANSDDLSQLSYGLTKDTGDIVEESFDRRAEDNARHLMYVGVSRARDLFVAVGDTTADSNYRPADDTDGIPGQVVDALPTQNSSEDQRPWSELRAAMPDDTVVWNDFVSKQESTRYTLNGKPVYADAKSQFESAKKEVEPSYVGQLLPGTDVDDTVERKVPRRYTYSALKDAEKCGRAYLLKHVYGRNRRVSKSGGNSTNVNHRLAGDLFHYTAEYCFGRSTDRGKWKSVLYRVAKNRGVTDTPTHKAAVDYVDRLLAHPVAEYTVRKTEYPVVVEYDGISIYGRVDALVERPSQPDELMALDFKTGLPRWTESEQLQFYVAGANQSSLSQPVTTGAFVQLGSESATLDTRVDLRNTSKMGMAGFNDTVKRWIDAARNASLNECGEPENCELCADLFGEESSGL